MRPNYSGRHKAPRVVVQLPNGDGQVDRWRSFAERAGVSLVQLIGSALESFAASAPPGKPEASTRARRR